MRRLLPRGGPELGAGAARRSKRRALGYLTNSVGAEVSRGLHA